MQAGDRHTLLYHKMPCLMIPRLCSGLPQSELRVSMPLNQAPAPYLPERSPLLFLLFFCIFFFLHFPTLPVPDPLHTVLHEGLGLPWLGLCAAARHLSQSQLGHCFRKDLSLFLG